VRGSKFFVDSLEDFRQVWRKHERESDDIKPAKLYRARDLKTILVVGVNKKLMAGDKKSVLIKLYSIDLTIYH
jgi:hypothetical protein